MGATTIEILPQRGSMPTWGEVRALLGDRAAVVVDPRTGAVRPCGDAERFERGPEYQLRVGDEMVAAWWVGREPDEADLEAVGEIVDLRTLGGWQRAGFSLHVAVLAHPAWRNIVRAFVELLDGVVVGDVGPLDLVGLGVGLYPPARLA